MQELEFYGGPFDGHSESLDAGQPADRVAWLVCGDAFGMLGGKPIRNLGTVTSVAIYELEVDDGRLRYEHSRSVSFKELMISLETRCTQIKKGPIHDI